MLGDLKRSPSSVNRVDVGALACDLCAVCFAVHPLTVSNSEGNSSACVHLPQLKSLRRISPDRQVDVERLFVPEVKFDVEEVDGILEIAGGEAA